MLEGYGSKCWVTKVKHIHKLTIAEMWMLRWMCDHTRLNKIIIDHICQKVQVARIEDKIKQGRLRWFGHVLHRPTDGPIHRCEAMVRDGVKKGMRLT